MGIQVYINKKIDKYFEDLVLDLSKIPFSFVYDEIKYSGFDNKNFKIINHKKELINKKIEHVFDLLFKEQIKISLCLSYYQSHGFYEYTVWFENISNYDSKLFKEFKSEFFVYGENPVLKGILGDHVNKYKPYAIDLSLQKAEFISSSGRATHINFPYFNLEHGDEGTIFVIGWAGTWSSSFEFDGEKTKVIVKAVNDICTFLKPGEKIRTALFRILKLGVIFLVFYFQYCSMIVMKECLY